MSKDRAESKLRGGVGEKKYTKGGSIQDLVIHYLQKCREPMKAKELLNYIAKYRENITCKS